MREFQCNEARAQVAGPVVETFLAALGPYRSRGERVVARNCGVTTVATSADTFYTLQGYLDALQEFQQQFNQGLLQRIGVLIFDKAAFPPGIDTAEKALASIGPAYQLNHREAHGGIGTYAWQPGERGGVMVCDNPYPCAFDTGILTSVAKRFAPEAKVTHVAPERCRHTGADSCTYKVEW